MKFIRNWPSILICGALILNACQLVPPATLSNSPPSSSTPGVTTIEGEQVQGKVTSDNNNTDTLTLDVKILPREQFQTQGISPYEIYYVRARVIGPGIDTPLWNKEGMKYFRGGYNTQTTLKVDNVPKGNNRVVFVSVYDSLKNRLLDLTGHYSTPEIGDQAFVNVERRFDLLGRVMELWLQQAQQDPKVLRMLYLMDLDRLQKVIEQGLLYQTTPSNMVQANTFAIDPTRIKADMILNMIQSLGQGEALTPDMLRDNKTALQSTQSATVQIVDEFGVPQAGSQVYLSAPGVSSSATGADGIATLTNIPQGDWRVRAVFSNTGALDESPVLYDRIIATPETANTVITSQQNPIVMNTLIIDGLRWNDSAPTEQVYVYGKGITPQTKARVLENTNSTEVPIVSIGTDWILVDIPNGVTKNTTKIQLFDPTRESNQAIFRYLTTLDQSPASLSNTTSIQATEKALNFLMQQALGYDDANDQYGFHIQSQAARALALGQQNLFNVTLGTSEGDGSAISDLNGGGLRQLMDRLWRAQDDLEGFLAVGGIGKTAATMWASPAYAAYSGAIDNTYDASLLKIATWLSEVQYNDGSWLNDNVHPILSPQGNKIQATANNLILLRRARDLQPTNTAYKQTIDDGVAFLRSQKNNISTTQDLVHFILGLRLGGQVSATNADLVSAMNSLVNKRVDLGGTPKQYAWKYYAAYANITAYATGQVMTALQAMGVTWDLEPTGQNPEWVNSYRGAYEWLVANQLPDGSYPEDAVGAPEETTAFDQTLWPAIALTSASSTVEVTTLEPQMGEHLRGQVDLKFHLNDKSGLPRTLNKIQMYATNPLTTSTYRGTITNTDPRWEVISPTEANVTWTWNTQAEYYYWALKSSAISIKVFAQ